MSNAASDARELLRHYRGGGVTFNHEMLNIIERAIGEPTVRWISVNERVPDNRRQVFTWGLVGMLGLPVKSKFAGVARCNVSTNGAKFDNEGRDGLSSVLITHWAEIEGPAINEPQPPRKR